jgi:glycine/D-amino acid oxidase-like deaminating enzyme
VVRHQLLITEPTAQVDPADPIIRVVDAAVYLRPARGGLMFGGFEPALLTRGLWQYAHYYDPVTSKYSASA